MLFGASNENVKIVSGGGALGGWGCGPETGWGVRRGAKGHLFMDKV